MTLTKSNDNSLILIVCVIENRLGLLLRYPITLLKVFKYEFPSQDYVKTKIKIADCRRKIFPVIDRRQQEKKQLIFIVVFL